MTNFSKVYYNSPESAFIVRTDGTPSLDEEAGVGNTVVFSEDEAHGESGSHRIYVL